MTYVRRMASVVLGVTLMTVPMLGFAGTNADRQLADMIQLDQENQAWLGDLTVLDGRMMAVMGLYRAGKIDEAKIQIQMALEMSRTLTDQFAGQFANYGGEGSTEIIEKMTQAISAKVGLDPLAEQYAAWRNGLLGVRFQTPYSLGTQLRAVAKAVKKAAEIYRAGLSPDGNEIAQLAHYYTAFGIVQAAKQVILLYVGEATTPDQQIVFENIRTELDHLDILMPGVMLPKMLHTDPDGFDDIADRIGVKAVTLR